MFLRILCAVFLFVVNARGQCVNQGNATGNVNLPAGIVSIVDPVVGQLHQVSAFWNGPHASVVLYIGLPINGPGLDTWVCEIIQWMTPQAVGAVGSGTGACQLFVPIPNDAQLVGVEFASQALATYSAGPACMWSSNATRCTIR